MIFGCASGFARACSLLQRQMRAWNGCLLRQAVAKGGDVRRHAIRAGATGVANQRRGVSSFWSLVFPRAIRVATRLEHTKKHSCVQASFVCGRGGLSGIFAAPGAYGWRRGKYSGFEVSGHFSVRWHRRKCFGERGKFRKADFSAVTRLGKQGMREFTGCLWKPHRGILLERTAF